MRNRDEIMKSKPFAGFGSIIGLLLLFGVSACGGTYHYGDDVAKQQQEEYAKQISLVGKKYWLNANSQLRCYYAPDISSKTFDASGKTTFTVTEFVHDQSGLNGLYRVAFEDGKAGFLVESKLKWGVFQGPDSYFVEGQYDIYEEDPDILMARVKKAKPIRQVSRDDIEKQRKQEDDLADGGKYQYSDDIVKKSKQEDLARKTSFVGKKFWVRVVKYPVLTFYDSPYILARKFSVSEKTTFTVTEYVVDKKYGVESFYRVVFEDGKVGFLETFMLKHCLFPGPDTNFNELQYEILEEDPDVIRARVKKAEQNAERKRQARGGVTIGMTKEQVLNSMWGKPRKVNKDIAAGLVHEQWVYERGYLYFENDILTSIQLR